MKLLLLFLLIVNLNALEIIKSKTFTISSVAKNKTASFSISMKDNESYKIEKAFKKATAFAKNSNICVGGKYSIFTTLKVTKKEKFPQELYKGNMNFNCEFKDNIKYENLLTQMKSLNSFRINQQPLNFVLSENEKENIADSLEDEAYKYAKTYTKKLNTFYEYCHTKKITLNSNAHYPQPIMMKSMAMNSAVSSPIENKTTQSLNVNYIFKCD
ncbi:MAG: hypothetical protein GQ570_11475 [Helicobacteraceae bacterium]|nr:hypothetical protein [Helicobacteraceae bacterium]